MGPFAFQHKEPKFLLCLDDRACSQRHLAAYFRRHFRLIESGDGGVIMDSRTTASSFQK